MVCWGHWITKDGKHICIETKGAKQVVITGVVLSVVGVAGSGAAGAFATEASTAPGISVETDIKISRGKNSAREGRYHEAWERLGYKLLKNRIEHSPTCAPHATGEASSCLQRQPCTGLQRTLATVTDDKGNTITVSVVWVAMPDFDKAWHFKLLIDKDSSGNMTPISDPASAHVRFTGKHYRSRLTGSTVVVADAAAAHGHPTDEAMDAATDVAVEFPWSDG
jgi:hypothetical protein